MNNKTLLSIAKEHGSPIYVYDAHKIEVQYKLKLFIPQMVYH